MKLAHVAVLSMVISGNLAAEDIKLAGTIIQVVKPIASSSPATIKNARRAAMPTTLKTKKIALLKVVLSAKAKKQLASQVQTAVAHTRQFATSAHSRYPAQIQLGMNNVPVLDQGFHGTCVTFASTVAINAALNKGDYTSQLCQLQLGTYLEKEGYAVSGWDGAWGRDVLSQLELFGIVNKQQQAVHGCAGVLDYPVSGQVPRSEMSVEEYHQISEPLGDGIVFWSPVLDISQAFTGNRTNTNKVLDRVKAALNVGDRLIFGVLLMDTEVGTAGAVGTNKATYDSWIVTPEIVRKIFLKQSVGGHEMVITGYDDTTVVIDDYGRAHHGFLTLRSSWGDTVGDRGNFYMSYSYFKLLVVEVLRIHTISLQ